MSKIGRKFIEIGKNTQVTVEGNMVHVKGPKWSGDHELPELLVANLDDKHLMLAPRQGQRSRDVNRVWGLHRALLANKIKGAETEFERTLEINGLGYKAALSGTKIVFNLGYTHKIDFELPKNVSVVIDSKTGQKLLFKSPNKELVGHVCSVIRALRPPEPYKGKGVKFESEVIVRKAGKAKASAG